jgi:hypothetical protein
MTAALFADGARLAAVHEAAHVLVADACGIGTDYVCIRCDHRGVTGLTVFDEQDSRRADAEAAAAAMFAGAVVGVLTRDHNWQRGARADLEDVHYLVSRGELSNSGVDRALRRAYAVLLERAPELFRLAEALVARGSLVTRDIQSIIRGQAAGSRK